MGNNSIYRKVGNFISLIILAGFILSVMPCVTNHDDTHENTSICICVCCDNISTYQKVIISKIPVLTISSKMKLSHIDETFLHRDIIFTLLQPPKNS